MLGVNQVQSVKHAATDSWTSQGLSRAWRGTGRGTGEWGGGGADRGWTDDDDSDELMLNVLRCQLTY